MASCSGSTPSAGPQPNFSPNPKHSQLVATGTMEEACVLAIFIERAAKLQLMAEAVAPIKPIDPALAREAHDYRLKQRAVAATFHYFARRALKKNPDALG